MKHLSLPRQTAGGSSGQHGHPHRRNPSDTPVGAKSSDTMFAPHLLLREKVVSGQYLGKYNICIYGVIYDRVKFHTVLQVMWNVFTLAFPLTAFS